MTDPHYDHDDERPRPISDYAGGVWLAAIILGFAFWGGVWWLVRILSSHFWASA